MMLERRGLRFAAFCIVLVAAWQLVALLGIWPQYIFPAPAGVLSALWTGMSDGTFLLAALASLQRMLIGFGIAFALGFTLGVAIARSRIVGDTAGQLVLGLQTLPSICWLPLAVLWFGLNDAAILFVVVAGAVGSITMAISSGIAHVPPLFINAARTMGASGWNLYSKVIFPAALPAIIAGARQGWSFAWRSLMAGELLFFSVGLGQLLQIGRELNDINQVAAVMLAILAVGLLTENLVFASLERAVKRKRGLEQESGY
ncbi:MAG: ABC transporter permease [Candidatus ainarchaeum sp.]|nr:ABC transporter permease [Candidatus ainarchaeum sp.]